MDFSFSQDDRAFGDRLRGWLQDNLDPDWRRKCPGTSPEWISFQRGWDALLYSGGWGGVFWPSEFGGMGASLAEKAIYSQVSADMDAPMGLGKLGKRLLAPIIMSYGSAEQQERFLPPMLRGDTVWCQGFSEPGAGSDLAALRTRGVLDGDVLRVTGQKIWTSHAPYSDWCFALIRTDPDAGRHNGISLIVFPLDAEGVDIRRIKQIDGRDEFAEVFLEDVVVPLDQVIGPMNDGWNIAMSVLARERGAEMAFQQYAESSTSLNTALGALTRRPVAQQAARSGTVGELQAAYFAMQINAMRLLSTQLEGGDPNELASVLKLQSSEAARGGSVDHLSLAGPSLLTEPETGQELLTDYLKARSLTIASGSSEIQRTIIARRVLGMG